jgi:hypothetical protein
LTNFLAAADHPSMARTFTIGRILAVAVVAATTAACVVHEYAGPEREECRTVFRRRADVEVCRTRCSDDGCKTRCTDQERWSREHHCWVE